MSNRSFFISCIIFIATTVAVFSLNLRGTPVVVKTNLDNLPMNIAGYSAIKNSFSQSVYDELNADLHVYRHYQPENGKQIDLYIGYYGTAKGGRTPHNPFACFPSSGWTIMESTPLEIDPESAQYPGKVTLNYMLVKNGNLYNVVLHWYQSDANKVLASGIQKNIQRFKGRVLYNKNDGAFVRVSALSDAENIASTRAQILFFTKQLLNLLPQYWPKEVIQSQ